MKTIFNMEIETEDESVSAIYEIIMISGFRTKIIANNLLIGLKAYKKTKKLGRLLRTARKILDVQADDRRNSELVKEFGPKSETVKIVISDETDDIIACSDDTHKWTSCWSSNGQYHLSAMVAGYGMESHVIIIKIYDSKDRYIARRLYYKIADGVYTPSSKTYGNHGFDKNYIKNLFDNIFVEHYLSKIDGVFIQKDNVVYDFDNCITTKYGECYFDSQDDYIFIEKSLENMKDNWFFDVRAIVENSKVNLIPCSECGRYESNFTQFGVCHNCNNESICHYCGDYCDNSEMYTVHGEYEVCLSCLDELYDYCENCDEYILNIDMIKGKHSHSYCKKCFNELNLNICEDCLEIGKNYHVDENGFYLCDNCKPESKPESKGE